MSEMQHFPKFSYVSGNFRCELSLDRFSKQFADAQQWLGNRVLEDCKAYMPLLTGNTASLLFENISWRGVESALARGLNGIILGVNWTNLGNTLGSYVNTWIDSIDGFVSNFDWSETGDSLSNGLNGMVKTIKWDDAAQILSTTVVGLLDMITSFLEGADWQEIGRSVATFLRNIEWGDITSSLFEGIGAALGGIAAFI